MTSPRVALIFLSALVLSAAVSPGVLAAPPPEETQELLDEAEGLLPLQPEEALRVFRRAAKMGGDDCLDCHLGLARGYRALAAYRDALEHAEKALALDPQGTVRAAVHSEIGLAQLGLGDKGSPEVAAEHFKNAIAISEGASSTLYFNLGLSLLRSHRDEEGVAVLKELLELDPGSLLVRDARSLIDEPRRAREDLVPSFAAATLDGDFLSPEELEGKVVLYDFWATWCSPCHKALPNLRRLQTKMKDTPFVLLSISSDHDEVVLREFIDKEDMVWPQIHDKSGSVARDAFKVRSYPTYILVDHEGKVVFRRSGWSPGIDIEVVAQVKRALKKARKAGES